MEAAVFMEYAEGLDCIGKIPFDRGDVAETLWAEPSENDGPSGTHIARLKDGRFALLIDWQDYTGHGCQCGSDLTLYKDATDLWNLGLTQELRDRLPNFKITSLAYEEVPADPDHLRNLDTKKVKQ